MRTARGTTQVTGLRLRLLTATMLAGSVLGSHPTMAQSAAQLSAIQDQISSLQAQLKRLQTQAASRDAALRRAQGDARQARIDASRAVAQSAAASPASGKAPASGRAAVLVNPNGQSPASLAGPSPQAIVGTAVDKPNATLRMGGVSVTLGGFLDLTGIYRSRNETAGTGTSFSNIPYANSQNAHTSELRGTSQVSRFSMLVQGKVSGTATVAGYSEIDFNSAGTSSNSYQSNSYTPRIRHLYATYDDSKYGVHLLAGQTWSFLTPDTSGMLVRKEQIPLTIDTNYIPGFTQTRSPQLRLAKDFGGKYWVGVSFEAPQANYSYQAASGAVVNGQAIDYSNPGSGNLNSTANYSVDVAPDIIVKVAADTGYGHYEAYGLGRLFKSRVSTLGAGTDKVVFGGGVGASATVPLIPKLLDVTGNVLAGYGVGRYGSGQLPDASFKANGEPAPLPEVIGLVGLIGHPVKAVDLYGYLGMEQIGRETNGRNGTGPGYGGSNLAVAGCGIELGTCNAQTRSLVGGAVGGWWRFLQGNFGTMLAGAQYGYTKKTAFHGVGGRPTTDESIALVAFRYLPFQ